MWKKTLTCLKIQAFEIIDPIDIKVHELLKKRTKSDDLLKTSMYYGFKISKGLWLNDEVKEERQQMVCMRASVKRIEI